MRTLSETDNEYNCDISAPCFKYLSAEETMLISASKTQVLFKKGENLTKQGAFASYVLFVIEGIAKQFVEDDGQRNYNLQLVTAGTFVGLSSVFTKNTFDYTTTALSDTRVFLIENAAIANVGKTNALFAYNIIQRYCKQNASLFQTIRNLVHKQMNGRMADTLLYLLPENFGGLDVTALLSRKDIADFAGISTESAVKILKTFEKESLISLDEKSVKVLNKLALEAISKNG